MQIRGTIPACSWHCTQHSRQITKKHSETNSTARNVKERTALSGFQLSTNGRHLSRAACLLQHRPQLCGSTRAGLAVRGVQRVGQQAAGNAAEGPNSQKVGAA
jgi:hypothetical protein